MLNYMILAAAEAATDAVDVYTLGNSIFSMTLKVVLFAACMIGAIVLGGKLRVIKDSKKLLAQSKQDRESIEENK